MPRMGGGGVVLVQFVVGFDICFNFIETSYLACTHGYTTIDALSNNPKVNDLDLHAQNSFSRFCSHWGHSISQIL